MKTLRVIFISVITFLIAAQFALPQTASQPLELPNFIIEGKEQIDIQVGGKQMPEYVTMMKRSQMDSLNILEKPRNYIVFPITLSSNIIAREFPNGFIIGNFGSFFTTEIQAGYKTVLKDYALSGIGGISGSRGNVENADYFKVDLGLQSDYIAPDKFFIFGGSKTTTNFDFAYQNYKLYALSTAPKRDFAKINFTIKSDGNFEGFDFSTGANAYWISQTGAGAKVSENLFAGFLDIKTKDLEARTFGGHIEVNLRQFRARALNFYEIFGYSNFTYLDFDFEPAVGFQFANASNNKNRVGLLLNLQARKIINKDFSLRLLFANRLKNQSFAYYYEKNPYLVDSLEIDYGNETLVGATIRFEPTKNLNLVGGTNFVYTVRRPCFENTSLGYFDILYLDATIFNIFIEGIFTDGKIGDFSLRMDFVASSLRTNKNDIPYEPSFKIRADYSKRLLDFLAVKATLQYIGERFANIENSIKLSSYNMFSIGFEYLYNSKFNISLGLQNLLNSNVIIWNGYKEREFNFKLGITYKF